MNIVDKIVTYLFPLSLLEGTPWLSSWKEKERADFVAFARLFFPIVIAIYIANFFLFDKPMGLTPESFWLTFRLSMAAVALAAFLFYLSPLNQVRYYRLPAILAVLTFCYFQARVTVWYPEAPWLYCFFFVGIATLFLRTSSTKSLFFTLIAIAIQWPSLQEAGIPNPTLISASTVTVIMVLASRSTYQSELKYFLLNQQNNDTQLKNIELNIEFTDRIKSFIPSEIASRLERQLSGGRTTVLQAIDEVLRPRKKEVACLFSDIRDFTEGSKDLDLFIGDLVLPNIKACTAAVENHSGIPRKIGDLIFAYYDSATPHLNLLNSIRSGFEISEINNEQNAGNVEQDIERYILISIGDAIVGNVGGFDSSVEITALGSPVNFLARVDEITKEKVIKNILSNGDLVICQRSFEMLQELGLRPEANLVDLNEYNLSIRNFPDQKILYTLPANEYNKKHIAEYFSKPALIQDAKVDENPGEAA